MRSHCWRFLFGSLIAFPLLTPADAAAKFFLITHGDTITNVGAGSTKADPMMRSCQVGYKYGYFGLFWIDLWTYDGTFCIYEGKQYNPISQADAAKLLGKSENDLSPPFLYQVPLGWLVFGPIIVCWAFYAALKKKKGNEITTLFQDARYQKALEILNEHYAKQTAAAATAESSDPPDPAEDNRKFRVAFDAGVEHLVGVGIAREEAERNLATMVHVMFQANQQPAAPT